MSASPVFVETCPIRTTAFDGYPVKAAVDRGCTLTKVIFLPKDNSTPKDDFFHMRCLTFDNTHFEEALVTMKQQAVLPTSGNLHITGWGCETHKAKVKEILGLETVFIDEFAMMGRGVFLTVKHSPLDHIFHPIPDISSTFKVQLALLEKVKETSKPESEPSGNEAALFPALCLSVGSGAALYFIDANGVVECIGTITISGRPFLGLAKCLLGTNDYGEIMELASKGNPANIDLLARDVHKENPNSQYGHFAPEYPVFPFGKAAETEWKQSQCTRADMALSLLSLCGTEIAHKVCTTMIQMRIKQSYLTGNFFRSEVIRRVFYERMQTFQGMNLQCRIIKTGHTCAMGAMLTNLEELAKIVRVPTLSG